MIAISRVRLAVRGVWLFVRLLLGCFDSEFFIFVFQFLQSLFLLCWLEIYLIEWKRFIDFWVQVC